MKDPCKNCIVQPMCRAGCIEIWNYRNYLKTRHNSHFKLSNCFIWGCVAQSSMWALLLFADVLNHVDSWHVIIGDFTFNILWQYIPYSTLLLIGTGLIISHRLAKRKIRKIENGKQSEYIWQKEMQESQTQSEGGDSSI